MFRGAIRSEMEEDDHFEPDQQLDNRTSRSSINSAGQPVVIGERDNKFRSRFPEIAKYELLQKYIPCVWRKEHGDRSLRGGLYLTENHIGFYCASKLAKESDERKLLIEIVTVTQVSKTRSLNIFPDSIAIDTAGGGRFIFSQLFSRNVVYKAICDLCGIQPTADSRRGSIDPSAFGDMDDDRTSLDRQSLQNETTHSSTSSASSTPPDYRRTLSVVPEQYTENDQPEAASTKFHTSYVSRVNSRIDPNVVTTSCSTEIQLMPEPEESVMGRRIILLLQLIAGLLVCTALVSVYRIVTTPAELSMAKIEQDLVASFGEAKHATEALIGVAQRAQIFLQAVCNAHGHGKTS